MRRPCIADTLAAKPSGKEDSKGEKCREREIAYSAKIVQSSNQSPTTFPRNTTPSSRALALMRNLAQTGLAAGKRNTHHERAAFTRLLRWLLLAARSSYPAVGRPERHTDTCASGTRHPRRNAKEEVVFVLEVSPTKSSHTISLRFESGGEKKYSLDPELPCQVGCTNFQFPISNTYPFVGVLSVDFVVLLAA